MSDCAHARVLKMIITRSNQAARYFSTFMKMRMKLMEQMRV